MKPSSTNPPDPNSAANAKLWFQTACIFAAAVAFGVIYNGSSPLGVRPNAAPVAGADSPASGLAAAKVTVPRNGFFNETLSMTLEPVSGPAPLPQGIAPAPAVATPQPQVPMLSWTQVKPLLETQKIVLVDARPKVAFDLGHIPGAVLLSSNATAPELQAFAAQHGKETPLVVYCASTTCRSSQLLAVQLRTVAGFANVSEMPGGFAEYTLAQGSAPSQPKP